MPAYTIAKDATDSAAPSPLATVTPGASAGVAVTGVYSAVLETGAAGDRLQLFRSTTGTTPVAATPEKLNSRQSAAGSTGASDWTTPPTAVGNPVILMGRSVGTAIVMQRRWVSHPRFPLIEMPSGSKFHYGTVVSNGVNEARTLTFVEPSRDVPPIGRFRGRRGTEPGGFFVQDNSRGFHGLSTAPQSCPGSTGYTFVNSLDWPDSVLGGMNAFLNLLTAAGGGPTQFTQAVDGTLTPAGALVKQTNKNLSGSLASAGLLLKQVNKILAGALTSSGAIQKQTGKPEAGTLTSSGSLVKQTGKLLSGALASSGALVKQTAHALAGTLTSAGALVKQTSKILAGTLTSSGAITAFKVALVSLAGTLTSSGTLTKQVGKNLAGTLTSAGTLSKRIFVSMAGTLTSAGALIGQKVATAARKVFIFIFDD